MSAALQRILDAQQACREDNTPYEYNKCGLSRVSCIECAWGIYITPSTVECLLVLTSGKWLRQTTVCFCQAESLRDRQDPPNPGLICMRMILTKNRCYPSFESFAVSLEEPGDLNILDAAPIHPVLEAGALPKFDMHLYKSYLNESHVRYLVKLYGIRRNFIRGAGNDCKPCLKDAPTSLKKWKDKFFLVDRRAAPIAMAWRHHDSSVADPFPRPSEYNAPDVAKLREVVISLRRPRLSILYVAGLSNVWKHAGRAFSIKDSEGKVITMAEFLRLPNFKGCKVAAMTLLPPGIARVTHLAPPAERLEDIPPKTEDMVVAEIPNVKDSLDGVNLKKETKNAIGIFFKKFYTDLEKSTELVEKLKECRRETAKKEVFELLKANRPQEGKPLTNKEKVELQYKIEDLTLTFKDTELFPAAPEIVKMLIKPELPTGKEYLRARKLTDEDHELVGELGTFTVEALLIHVICTLYKTEKTHVRLATLID
ncbi:hypothetical protein Tco_0929291 [Tanacetum coccineum]